jgi:hypothetical protein
MAVAEQPSSKPATITVRVRAILLGGLVLLILAGVGYAVHWLTGLRPLQVGSGALAQPGMRVVKGTNNSTNTGPPVYRWTAGGRVIYTTEILNTSSLPIRVDGLEQAAYRGFFEPTGAPTLSLPGPPPGTFNFQNARPFHPVTIHAGGSAWVVFTFRPSPYFCTHFNPGAAASVEETESVDLKTTVLGFVNGTQRIPLDPPLWMKAPSAKDCGR